MLLYPFDSMIANRQKRNETLTRKDMLRCVIFTKVILSD